MVGMSDKASATEMWSTGAPCIGPVGGCGWCGGTVAAAWRPSLRHHTNTGQHVQPTTSPSEAAAAPSSAQAPVRAAPSAWPAASHVEACLTAPARRAAGSRRGSQGKVAGAGGGGEGGAEGRLMGVGLLAVTWQRRQRCQGRCAQDQAPRPGLMAGSCRALPTRWPGGMCRRHRDRWHVPPPDRIPSCVIRWAAWRQPVTANGPLHRHLRCPRWGWTGRGTASRRTGAPHGATSRRRPSPRWVGEAACSVRRDGVAWRGTAGRPAAAAPCVRARDKTDSAEGRKERKAFQPGLFIKDPGRYCGRGWERLGGIYLSLRGRVPAF